MNKLMRSDLLSLEAYAEQRGNYRQRMLDHKQHRKVHLGPNATLYFEDRLTVQYQIQEMLRIEKIFEQSGIEEELAAYNPLIPDGQNLKATFMLEFAEPAQRGIALQQLVGIESLIWVQVEGFDKSYAIADEDLERSTDDKTSAVHFMRFEFSAQMIAALRNLAAPLAMGSDHDAYRHSLTAVAAGTRDSLLNDFE